MPFRLKYFTWDNAKSEKLKTERGISFEDVLFHVENGYLLDILEHPNQERYHGQRVIVVQIDDYAYLVPCVEEEECVVLKTVIPSRKATKSIFMASVKAMKPDSSGEKASRFCRKGEWRSVGSVAKERKLYANYAAATFRKDRRLNIRISSRDLKALQKKALEEGLP